MFKNLFGKNTHKTEKKVHCEITGAEAQINDTKALVRINGIIPLKNLINPKIDFENKVIHPDGKPPLKFYSELIVPDDLKIFFGPIYSIIDDLDDIESSTTILSEEGQNMFSGQGLIIFAKHIENGAEVIKIPETMFHAVIDTQSSFKNVECANWKVNYNSKGSKYRFKNIVKKMECDVEYGYPMPLFPSFDIGVSDCSDKNPKGTNYLFSTDNSYQKINLCCNESAVEFCKKNNTIVYYNDFLNKGKLRVLTSHTESINKKLQNKYLFRSSNI